MKTLRLRKVKDPTKVTSRSVGPQAQICAWLAPIEDPPSVVHLGIRALGGDRGPRAGSTCWAGDW